MPSHHFGGLPCPQFRGVDAIEIVKDWAVRQNSCIKIPAGSPSHISADAEAVLIMKVGTESRIQPATFRNVLAIPNATDPDGAVSVPKPNAAVKFLGVSESRHKKQNHNAAINVSFLKQTSSSTEEVRCYVVASRNPSVLSYCLER